MTSISVTPHHDSIPQGLPLGGLSPSLLLPSDSFKIAGTFLAFVLVLTAAVTGGMPALVMALAVGLAIRVYHHPQEVIAIGPLFLMACNVFLPTSARFVDGPQASELIYWAVGLLLITVAAVFRGRWSLLLRLPLSLRTFLIVVLTSSVYGFMRGNDPSYVFRQLYGSLLFVAYFAFAQESGDEEFFLRNLRKYGVACVLAFLVYYAWIFGELGIHKENTSFSTEVAIPGILFLARGGWKWWMASAMMFTVPLLLIARHNIVVFPLALAIMWAFTTASRIRRWLSCVLAGSIVLASLAPPYVEIILDYALRSATLAQIVPQGAQDSSSIADRGLQLGVAVSAVENSPVLGGGMGAEIEWQSVLRGDLTQGFVDNGWAYVALKMGLAGCVVFGWFVVALLRRMGGASLPLSTCLLSVLLLTMFTEPVFFQFTLSPLVGTAAGLLFAKRRQAA